MSDKEKLAEEFVEKNSAMVNDWGDLNDDDLRDGFLAGYEAAEAKFRPVKIDISAIASCPKMNTKILGLYPDGWAMVHTRDGYEFFNWLEHTGITHWMPLPEIGE